LRQVVDEEQAPDKQSPYECRDRKLGAL
jgi:hypothetical protein